MENQTDLSFYDTLKIDEVFKKQGWPIDQTNKSSLYKRFLKTYRQLNQDERELFIKLSLMYRWISLSDYSRLVIQLLEKVVEKYYGAKAQDIWIYPIKKAEHHGKIKSADVVSYLCSEIQTQHSDRLYKRKIHIIGSLDELLTKKNKFKEKPLVILDDFIGTGKYASDVVDELSANGIIQAKIIVCSLFISELGLKQVSSKGCQVEYIELTRSVLKELSSKEIGLLSQIETSLGVSKEFQFGYGESANLISLIRTPNNSLPIFWFDSGRSHSAPFPR